MENNNFKGIIRLNFLFSIMKLFLLISIYLTYDENVFKSISIKAERNSKEYYDARSM